MYLDYPEWLTPEAIYTLNKGYLLKKGDRLSNGNYLADDETPKTAYERVANRVDDFYPELRVKEDLFHCLYNGWIGLATPVFSNFGAERGLPISCFLTHVGDSVESIYKKKLTVAMMSKNGGGVATYFGDIRPEGSYISNGGTASNVRQWIKGYDQLASTVTQGNVRRGSIAAYLPIEHPDLHEVLLSKDHNHGDPRNFIDCNIAVTVTDAFMQSILDGDQDNKKLFERVMEMRLISGSPYIIFIDTVNNANPKCYKDLGLKVSTSNLCSEILLHTSPEYSAVCCLSSMNLSKWDKYANWKGSSGFTAVELGIILLDAVIQEFINKASGVEGLECAVAFAEKSRALG